MSKQKVTNKYIKSNFKYIIGIQYCYFQYMLYNMQPDFYISNNTDGWRCDIYVIDVNTCITTGYGYISNIKIPFNIIEEYENKAMKLHCDISDINELKNKKYELLEEFLNKYVYKR